MGFAHDSEYVGGLQQRLVRSVMAVPSSVRHARSMEAFWYTTLRHLVRRPDLRLISVWNPSFLTLLADQLSEHGDRLLDEEPKLKPALRARTAAERHALLWPRLRLISCWADGNSGPAARKLAALFPHARIRAKGLIATEGFISLPWEACDGAVLAVRSHFLEFLPADSVGRADPTRPQLAHELEPGHTYSVVITTGGGLYRYHLGDLDHSRRAHRRLSDRAIRRPEGRGGLVRRKAPRSAGGADSGVCLHRAAPDAVIRDARLRYERQGSKLRALCRSRRSRRRAWRNRRL